MLAPSPPTAIPTALAWGQLVHRPLPLGQLWATCDPRLKACLSAAAGVAGGASVRPRVAAVLPSSLRMPRDLLPASAPSTRPENSEPAWDEPSPSNPPGPPPPRMCGSCEPAVGSEGASRTPPTGQPYWTDSGFKQKPALCTSGLSTLLRLDVHCNPAAQEDTRCYNNCSGHESNSGPPPTHPPLGPASASNRLPPGPPACNWRLPTAAECYFWNGCLHSVQLQYASGYLARLPLPAGRPRRLLGGDCGCTMAAGSSAAGCCSRAVAGDVADESTAPTVFWTGILALLRLLFAPLLRLLLSLLPLLLLGVLAAPVAAPALPAPAAAGCGESGDAANSAAKPCAGAAASCCRTASRSNSAELHRCPVVELDGAAAWGAGCCVADATAAVHCGPCVSCAMAGSPALAARAAAAACGACDAAPCCSLATAEGAAAALFDG